MPVRLLVVEDDPKIAEPLCTGLEREGFRVVHVDTGAAAVDAAGQVDLVLLDLGLPDLDGRVVCRSIRATSQVPIIVVTARGDEIDRVGLLELGADDYVVKPFGFRELAARIGAVLRRTGTGADDVPPATTTVVGDVTIDRRARAVAVGGRPVALTPREFDLLAYLATDVGAVKRARRSCATCGTRTGGGRRRPSTSTSRRFARSSGST